MSVVPRAKLVFYDRDDNLALFPVLHVFVLAMVDNAFKIPLI